MRLVFHLQQRFHSKTNPLEFFKKEKKCLHLRKDINQVQVVTRGHANNYVELRGNTLHPTRCHRLATVCGIPFPVSDLFSVQYTMFSVQLKKITRQIKKQKNVIHCQEKRKKKPQENKTMHDISVRMKR